MSTQDLQLFNLKHAPFTKGAPLSYESKGVQELRSRFQWLLNSPGIGLLTGDAGVGKTAALHQISSALSPHEYQVIYHCETDFGRVDLYRQLALDFGLEAENRRSNVWRKLKEHIQDMVHMQHRLPVWIIDEAQNLPFDFFRDFPSFLNFAFDTKPLITVWFSGHACLNSIIKRKLYEALRSRIQVFVHFEPITCATTFKDVVQNAFNAAGATSIPISDSGIDLIRLASEGKYRQAGQIIQTTMHLATTRGINHLPDELIKEAIGELQ